MRWLARVPLPSGILGGLYAAGMPGSPWGMPVARLAQELAEAGISRAVCLVSDEELLDRAPAYYGALLRGEIGVPVQRFPVPDWGVPDDPERFLGVVRRTARWLRSGERVLAHCAGGCGRTGIFCACVLVSLGAAPEEAVAAFRAARGCGPENAGQLAFVEEAAEALQA